jgi:hypothetical protein
MKPTILDQLTAPMITPDVLRVRASYWRTVADRHVRARRLAQADRLRANCEAMERQARELETTPAPASIATGSIAIGRSKSAPRSCVVSASRFWELHSQAVTAIRSVYGANWRCHAPRDKTADVSLPPALRSCTGRLGGKIRWGRDHRMPAAMFWPHGMLPDGLIIAPPLPPERPGHPAAHGIDRDSPLYGAMLEAHRLAWGLIDSGNGVLITEIEHNRSLALADQRDRDEQWRAHQCLSDLACARRDAEKRRVSAMLREVEQIEDDLDFEHEHGRTDWIAI